MLNIHGGERIDLVCIFIDIVEDVMGKGHEGVVVTEQLFDELYEKFEDTLIVNELIDKPNEEDGWAKSFASNVPE